MQPQRMKRRAFLRGATLGGATLGVGLPMLECMLDHNGERTAFGQDLPLRFGTFVWGCGIVHESWVPSSTGTNWTTPTSLVPFERAGVKDAVTLLTGYNHRGSSPGHIPARGISLSSSHHTEYVDAARGPGYRKHAHPEPSIDTIVRKRWSGQTARDSIDIAVTRASPYFGVSGWDAGGQYRSPIAEPSELFSTLFSSFMPDDTSSAEDPQAAARLRLEQGVVDAVRSDAQRLRSRLGANDRRRLDQHLTSIAELERLVTTSNPSTAASSGCEVPSAPGSYASMREKGKLTADILALALACDISRVFTFEMSANQSNYVFSELGINGTLHDDISHSLGSRSADLTKVTELNMDVLAHLAARLKEIGEGAGTALDRTLIFGTSEHANANGHNYKDHPLIFVGKAGGNILAGQHHRHSNPSGNNDAPHVLYSAVRAVGVDVDSVGMAPQNDSRGSALPDRRGTELISGVFR